MSKIYIYTGSRISEGAKALRDSLREVGIRARIVREGGAEVPHARDVKVINWGVKRGGDALQNVINNAEVFDMLNGPSFVAAASDKRSAFRHLSDTNVPHVPYTQEAAVAEAWLDEGATVVARHVVNGHSGEGIEIASDNLGVPNGFWNAPLFTKYIKKKNEFRVHVFEDRVIHIQQKKKARDFNNPEIQERAQVRNLANGWIYAINDIDLSEEQEARINALARAAISAVGLDFGAVDIIYNQRHDRFYVLEVNSAPGLEGTTLQKYTNAIVNIAGAQ